MVVGNGLIANGVEEIVNEFPEVLFFASGVSDSKETDDKQFKREKNLLKQSILNNKGKKTIYFSTYSISDQFRQSEKYIIHKKEMEQIVQETGDYLIFRLTNVIGKKGNRNNLIRFLIDRINNEEEINVWKNVKRNIVGIDELVNVISVILKNDLTNKTILISHPFSFTMNEIVFSISNHLKKDAIITEVDKGDFDEFECIEMVAHAFRTIDQVKKEHYLSSLLKKYY